MGRLEDKVLILRFKGGSRAALCRIYQKYRTDLLKLAALLLNDAGDAEDAVHDVFVSFAQSADKLRLTGSLKGYLLTCVANNARNRNRANRHRQAVTLDEAKAVASESTTPEQWITTSDQLQRWSDALAKLPYTHKADQFVAWSLYVPDGIPPASVKQLGYRALYRFNLDPPPKWKIGLTIEYGIPIEGTVDFETWVVGAMAELSDDGAAPAHVTYENVMALAGQIRSSTQP